MSPPSREPRRSQGLGGRMDRSGSDMDGCDSGSEFFSR